MDNIILKIPETLTELDIIKDLFRDYALSLEVSLSFQNFERELEELPGVYSEPEGVLLLAMTAQRPAGCAALRKLEAGVCEMKRLYVRPEYRGTGLGRLLALEIIKAARAKNYDFMRLDTLKKMKRAVALYADLGFREIDAYCYNPLDDPIFMELDLRGQTVQ